MSPMSSWRGSNGRCGTNLEGPAAFPARFCAEKRYFFAFLRGNVPENTIAEAPAFSFEKNFLTARGKHGNLYSINKT